MTCKPLILATLALVSLAGPLSAEVAISEVGIQSSDEVMDPYLRQMRKNMVGGQRIPFEALRALADMGDGLAAFKMGDYLISTDKPKLLDDAIHYYSVAGYTGRDFAVPPLLRALTLDKTDLSKSQLKGAEDTLLLWGKRGRADASYGLAKMYLAGEPFGAKTEAGLALLEQVARDGNGEAAVELGMLYLKGRPDLPADPARARDALTLAQASDDLAARAIAENLLRGLSDAGTDLVTGETK